MLWPSTAPHHYLPEGCRADGLFRNFHRIFFGPCFAVSARSSIDAAISRGISFRSSQTEEDIDRTEARMIIEVAVARLDDFERQLIWLRFYEQRSPIRDRAGHER